MIKLGDAAKAIRKSHGLSQKQAAEELQISTVHLCNVENNNATPSSNLIDKYRESWGVDLYVFAWCQSGDVSGLPEGMREIAHELGSMWRTELERKGVEHLEGTVIAKSSRQETSVQDS